VTPDGGMTENVETRRHTIPPPIRERERERGRERREERGERREERERERGLRAFFMIERELDCLLG